jgi:hypothetical protein
MLLHKTLVVATKPSYEGTGYLYKGHPLRSKRASWDSGAQKRSCRSLAR